MEQKKSVAEEIGLGVTRYLGEVAGEIQKNQRKNLSYEERRKLERLEDSLNRATDDFRRALLDGGSVDFSMKL